MFLFSMVSDPRIYPFQMAHTPWTTGAVLRSVFLLRAAEQLSEREKESHCDF